MKRIGFIYDKICDIDNIKLAIYNSSKGKRHQKRVTQIIDNIDIYAKEIREMLRNKTYTPSDPIIKTIYDGSSGKTREIYKPRYYPDQIIHWCLMQQIQPIIMKGMYEYSCGSVPKRGTKLGQQAVEKWLRKDYKGTKYCLKMDITKFYPSVDREILKKMFARKIKDKDCLWLIGVILDGVDGLPIGYYTSQWFANFFLEGLDHFIKERLQVKYYIRYVDDLVLLGGNKKKLHKTRVAIEDYLESIGLKLKQNWQVFRVKGRGIDFLGFRFFHDRTILRKRNALRIRRRMAKIAKKKYLNYQDACAIISYWGWIKRSDSYNYYQRYVKPKVSLKTAKKVVSHYAKARNNRKRKAEDS